MESRSAEGTKSWALRRWKACILALGLGLGSAGISSALPLNLYDPTFVFPVQTVQWTQSTVAPHGFQNFFFYGHVGNVYYFSTCGSPAGAPVPPPFDTIIEVFDPTGKVVAYNDDYCGIKSSVQFQALSEGWYTVKVLGYGGSGGSTWMSYCMSLLW
jgi:hypothetical protein